MPPEADTPTLRDATAADAAAVAALQAASWRGAYRGSFADRYLDGPIEAERARFWQGRLAVPPPGLVTLLLAADGAPPAGFVCALRGHDARWGTLVDNLHVRPGLTGGGLGRQLMRALAARLGTLGDDGPVHLTVLDANAAARAFYARLGGVEVEGMVKIGPEGTALPVRRVAWASGEALARGAA